MTNNKVVLPDLTVSVTMVWICPHCTAPNKNAGFIPLDIITMNCNACKKPAKIDCRLALDKRGK